MYINGKDYAASHPNPRPLANFLQGEKSFNLTMKISFYT